MIEIRNVTLIDGREVPSDSLEWLNECRARHNHLQMILAMRGKARQGERTAYIEAVTAREGEEAGRRLREQVKKAWKDTA